MCELTGRQDGEENQGAARLFPEVAPIEQLSYLRANLRLGPAPHLDRDSAGNDV